MSKTQSGSALTMYIPPAIPASLRDLMAEVGPKWASNTSGHIKLMVDAYSEVLRTARDATAGMQEIRDAEYGRDDPRQVLDVYKPNDAANAPIALFLHGGAFTDGEKNRTPAPGAPAPNPELGTSTTTTNAAGTGAEAGPPAESDDSLGGLTLRRAVATGHAVWLQSLSQGTKSRCNELIYKKLAPEKPDETYLRGDPATKLWVEKVDIAQDGPNKGKTRPGIYLIDGDMLTICLGRAVSATGAPVNIARMPWPFTCHQLYRTRTSQPMQKCFTPISR